MGIAALNPSYAYFIICAQFYSPHFFINCCSTPR